MKRLKSGICALRFEYCTVNLEVLLQNLANILPSNCSKSTMKTPEKCLNLFKVDNKDIILKYFNRQYYNFPSKRELLRMNGTQKSLALNTSFSK